MQQLTIFSDTYTSTGANSSTFGSILAGDVSTAGANAGIYGYLMSTGAANAGAHAFITGNMVSGDVLTIGDTGSVAGTAKSSGAGTLGANGFVGGDFISGGVASTGDTAVVVGNLLAGGAASIGANSVVHGTVSAVGAITVGAGGVAPSQQALASSPVASVALTQSIAGNVASLSTQVAAAQSAFLTLGSGTLLAPTMVTDTTLFAGVYSAASFSTTAATTLYLDGQNLANQFWVFNIADILATGASSKVVLINGGAGSSVIWNTGGYASLGASSTMIGTILAKTYISVGAHAVSTGLGTACGGLFSATSYVSTGDTAQVGGRGCSGIGGFFKKNSDGTLTYDGMSDPTAVPEPETWALMIAGFVMTGVTARRRRTVVAS